MCIWTFATKNKTARFISRQPITPTRGTVCFCWSSRQRPRGSSSVFTRTMSYNKYTKSRLSRHDAFLHHTCIRLPNPASHFFRLGVKFNATSIPHTRYEVRPEHFPRCVLTTTLLRYRTGYFVCAERGDCGIDCEYLVRILRCLRTLLSKWLCGTTHSRPPGAPANC